MQINPKNYDFTIRTIKVDQYEKDLAFAQVEYKIKKGPLQHGICGLKYRRAAGFWRLEANDVRYY